MDCTVYYYYYVPTPLLLYRRSAVAATSYTSPVNSIAFPLSRFYLTSGGRLGIVRGPN